MRIPVLLVTAVAATAAHDAMMGRLRAPTRHPHRNRQSRAAQDGIAARNNQCLDIKDHRLQDGAAVQTWTCTGAPNQKIVLDNGRLRGPQNLCLDVPAGQGGNGAHVQVWTCGDNNPNQRWEAVGSAYRWVGSSQCLDVTDGLFRDGTLMQMWRCDAGNINQQFTAPGTAVAKPDAGPSVPPVVTGGALASTRNFLGFACIPFAEFVGLHPQIASFADAYVQAGNMYNIAPVLVGAISLQESSGRCDAPNGGLGQFQNDDAWRAYGRGDRYNCYDAVYGITHYMQALLAENNNNLASALRAYNGPVSQGGKPAYIDNIGAWMTGAFVYGPGT